MDYVDFKSVPVGAEFLRDFPHEGVAAEATKWKKQDVALAIPADEEGNFLETDVEGVSDGTYVHHPVPEDWSATA